MREALKATLFKKFLGKDIRKMSVEEYVYWVGLLQGEGFREYIDNFRRFSHEAPPEVVAAGPKL